MAELSLFNLAVLALDFGGYTLGIGFQTVDACAGQNLHALLDECLFKEVRHFGIFDGHDAVHHFDDRYLSAHIPIEAGKFDADCARADDEQLGWHFGGHHRMTIGPDAFAIGGRKGQVTGAGARCQDDVLGR